MGVAAFERPSTMNDSSKSVIELGATSLGIELGSTRIKACLIDSKTTSVLAVGSHEWENQLVDGLWTYPLDEVWLGLQSAFADLQQNVQSQFGTKIQKLGSLAISAMMHGYLAFDAEGELLVPFRTWRNTNTSTAAKELSDLFGFNIPLRWSIAHLKQSIIESQPHVKNIDFLTTLAGYVHWKLTGEKVLGIGDASGMFPIDSSRKNYDQKMVELFDASAAEVGFDKPLLSLLPEVLVAGQSAGTLTQQGALLLDPAGHLQPGALLAPAEGDAGTGMVATNAVAPRTGNISAGTSIFAMVVMDKPLAKMHEELDIVTTPVGDQVAMVHCNNGASEMAQWANMFKRFSEAAGLSLATDQVYEVLFSEALDGESDAGGLLAYNYLAGEPITGISQGRPLFVRTPGSNFNLANAFRAQLYGVFGTLSIGMEVLQEEKVELDLMAAHGGIFRTKGVAQRFLAAALNTPVSVSSEASEGGAWGAAVLCAFLLSQESNFAKYLNEVVFSGQQVHTVSPSPEDVAGYQKFLVNYKAGLAIEAKAVEAI